jgi:hypothetical protein
MHFTYAGAGWGVRHTAFSRHIAHPEGDPHTVRRGFLQVLRQLTERPNEFTPWLHEQMMRLSATLATLHATADTSSRAE